MTLAGGQPDALAAQLARGRSSRPGATTCASSCEARRPRRRRDGAGAVRELRRRVVRRAGRRRGDGEGAPTRSSPTCKALRRAPLADPYIGPAILEGRAAGVFFHEIFGHRVEGHRQKNEEEGQTFAKKIGEPIMPAFVSVYDDPTLARLGGVDLNGFYRYDDEGVTAQRATLVDDGVLRGFLLSRSPTRGFSASNGHGRRQEGRAVVSRQGNLVVEPNAGRLDRRAAPPAARGGQAAGEAVRPARSATSRAGSPTPRAAGRRRSRCCRSWSTASGSTAGPTSWCAASIWSARRCRRCRGSSPPRDDYQTFNGYCGAESGFVPVSATSPSLLVQQIEIERRDKGSDKPPVLPAPVAAAAPPGRRRREGAR